MSREFRERLARWFPLSEGEMEALAAHYERLCRWNKVLNLTRIDQVGEAVERHYCESLFLASHLPEGQWRIADIGSGAGFPGFPVAVVRPECTVALIESHQRKAVFLREVSRGLGNVRVIARRAEDVTEQFDWAVSRAVSFEDLSASLRRLAPRAALLTGADMPGRELGFDWEPAIPLSWGQRRHLLISNGPRFT